MKLKYFMNIKLRTVAQIDVTILKAEFMHPSSIVGKQKNWVFGEEENKFIAPSAFKSLCCYL